ncbi:MAG: Gfo/Idh/MocA family oxidoreductase [Bryobacterales bacterium]|nr:Gfo/Idh/MocA family oxidoreductase [Bryobacterales bacterium]
MSDHPLNRRDFVRASAAAGATLGVAGTAMANSNKLNTGRVIGANDRINVGVLGVGGRGTYVGRAFAKVGQETSNAQIVAVSDVYQKRVNRNKEFHKCDGYLDYREIIARKDVDAVIVATPDHWHAKMALEAMDAGKDVYLEKPMCHTLDEIRQLVQTVRETKRVLQVGSQTTSSDQWHRAKKAISDGMIGDMLLSQGSYHRNSVEGEWNWPIDAAAGPNAKGEDYINWDMWLGPAQKRKFDADRFFRFRKYWDYSGGIATDLFFHVAAPMNICWGEPQFPTKVTAAGGIYVFRDEREVPDTFHLIAEYAGGPGHKNGHSLVLTSSMANSEHIPGLIRGHEGTIIMVEEGRFEGRVDYITVKPEGRVLKPEYKEKWGSEPFRIPVDQADSMATHVSNFLGCMRTRQQPTLPVETAACAQAVITTAVMAYREGKVKYFDPKTYKALDKPVS